MRETIENQRIVIIGGSSGLGLATAIRAGSLGARVVIGGRSAERLIAAKGQIPGGAEEFCVDTHDEKSVEAFFSKIGSFDHLVTPGAESSPGTFQDASIARKSFDSKFWGQYYAAKHGVPHMRKGGSIVFFSGVLGQRPLPHMAIMASINSAVEGLARALAVELAPLRVNVIAPGSIDSPRLSSMPEREKEALVTRLTQQLPLRRLGIPDEVAQGVLYLISNGYVTGTTLCVDGGYVLR